KIQTRLSATTRHSALSGRVIQTFPRQVFAEIAGAYDMRVGDAHPTGSKVTDAIKLAGVDEENSPLRQGEQLIHNVGQSIWYTGKFLFGETDDLDEQQ
ncbi:hypothetical protein ABQ012_22940, partial [Xanthomonas hortorum pv. hederae]